MSRIGAGARVPSTRMGDEGSTPGVEGPFDLLLHLILRDEVELGEGLRAIDVYRSLCEVYPGMAGMNGSLMYAVNAEYVDADTPLQDGDELALIPPVSGGADAV